MSSLAGFYKKVLFSGVLAASVIAGSAGLAPASAAKCAAEGFINTVSKKMLSAGKSQSTNAFRSLIRSHADIDGITSFAIGKYRRAIPTRDRAAVNKEIVNFMARTMAGYGKKFKGDRVAIARCRKSGKFLTVDSKLVQPNRRTQKFVWKLRGSGNYKISDLNVQGIWLAQLMRTNFNSAIKKSGGNISGLYAYLGVKNRTVDRK